MIKTLFAALAAAAMVIPAQAEPIKESEYKTMHSMGCMLLGECTDDVVKVTSMLDISSQYDNTEEFTGVTGEFHNMIHSLNQVGVNVFLADEKYFPAGHRGVYHTVSNNFFLNKNFMGSPSTLMMVMRHEGWHAAQDCMAGTIDNSLIAIIEPEDEVPMIWRVMAERTYPANAVPSYDLACNGRTNLSSKCCTMGSRSTVGR